MSLGVLALGLFSGLRPATSLAAVIALLKTPRPRRPLLVFCIAGFASSWLIGMLVVWVFHGANTAFGGSTFTDVLDVAFGAAALTAAVALHQGWSPHWHRRQPATSGESTAERIGRNLREPSARVAAAAGVATHIPGLVYLVALNAISSARPGVVDAGAQVAVYDALWFLVPVASLVLVFVRPGAAVRYLEAATAWVRRHDHAVVVGGLLLLGGYLVVKGAVRLLT
jgi:Sap, sulfolipid-1-addressing protein